MKPLSKDLKSRIVYHSMTDSIRNTAKIFNISPNTVFVLKKSFIETGEVEVKKPKKERIRLISKEGEMFLAATISKEPDLTLSELIDIYYQAYQVKVSMGTMANTIASLNITRKKKHFSDPRKHTTGAEKLKQDYDEQLSQIAPDKRFYMDQTGNGLNMSRAYGRSYRGDPVYDEKPMRSAETINTIAIATTDGIKAQFDYKTSLTVDVFLAYLQIHVLPILNNGQTLIMDRHPVHTSKEARQFFKEHHINYLYLPPYSPELNPIEEVFSKLKNYIKGCKPRETWQLIEAIKNGFEKITISDIHGYFEHSMDFSII